MITACCLSGRRLLCVALLFVVSSSSGRTFVHPGVFNNQAELDLIKERVAAGKEPWKSAYAELDKWETNATPSDALTTIGSEKDALTFRLAGHMVYRHSLRWAVTGNVNSAQQAIALLNAWAKLRKINEFVGSWGAKNAAHLKTSWAIPMLIGGAEIIRHYRRNGVSAGWKDADIAAFEAMARNVLYPFYVYTNKCSGWSSPGCAYSDSPEFDSNPIRVSNWETSWCTSRLALATFVSDEQWFDKSVEYLLWCLPRYVYPSGQCGESCRDCTHNEMGIIGLVEAAEIAWKQGVDAYGALNNRLAKGLEYRASQFFGGVSTVCNRSTSSKSCSGKGEIPGWEIGLNHYKNRVNVPVPNTKKYVETRAARPEPFRWNFMGATTLTHAELGNVQNAVAISDPAPLSVSTQKLAAYIDSRPEFSVNGRCISVGCGTAVMLRISRPGKAASIVPINR